MKIDNCPICDSDKWSNYLEVKDHSTSQETFQVVRCERCDFLFTNPRPSDEEIGAYYESDNYISHTNQKQGLFGLAYQTVRKRALKQKLNWITKHAPTGNMLDYGSGTGEFLNYCKTKGWNVRGLELAEKPRLASIKNYELDVRSPDKLVEIEKNSIDVITLWHVLEHVSSLNETMTLLAEKLKQTGVLVLALPNPESYDARHYGQHWAAWDVPIHFYHFAKRDVNKLAAKHGLKVVETINMPFDAYYVSLLSEEYKTGKKNWASAVINGLRSNQKAKDTTNASSLTYILRKL